MDLPTLRFIGHGGECRQPKNARGKVMFIPDANLVLNLLKHHERFAELPSSYRDFLLATRAAVHKQWHVREKWIPVNHTFAALELSNQDVQPNYATFDGYFRRFLKEVYLIENVDPRWDRDCYDDSMKLIDTFFATLQEQSRKALELMPRGSPTNAELEKLLGEYCEWLEANADQHEIAGGEPLYLAVYAFAGSPQARCMLQTEQVSKRGIYAIARNVAWDQMYLIHRYLSYVHAQYDDDLICTADNALTDLLGARINHGPRYAPSFAKNLRVVESYGSFEPYPLARLEVASRLTVALSQRLDNMFQRLSKSFDVMPAGRLGHLENREVSNANL